MRGIGLLLRRLWVRYFPNQSKSLTALHLIGETNADERIWLVFWEAGIILQVPAGVFVIYPSALLLHFNVHVEGMLSCLIIVH